MSADDAFRRFMASASSGSELSCADIMRDHPDEWLDRAAYLAQTPAGPGLDAFETSAHWVNRLCAALRSGDRLERMSAELALRIVHLRLTGGRHGTHDA